MLENPRTKSSSATVIRTTLSDPSPTTGLLFAKRPWFSGDFGPAPRMQVGELVTFKLEDESALHVHIPFQGHLPLRKLVVGERYGIQDLGARYNGDEPGLGYELDGMRLFRISDIP